jgi:replicative DNA helicase
VPTPVSVGYYGRIVLEASLYRRVEQTGTRLVQAGRSRRGEVDDVFGLIRDECQQLVDLRRRYLESTTSPPAGAGPTPVGALLRETSVAGRPACARSPGGR